ncbi:GTP-binding protein [Clostridium oryzae]|uniref:Tetracycline resistance protein TetM from transposon TnFO1 n=1 Tax=Clostridium oryzae TaxID=1450648 RepID=A0A1V4IUT8_9CLOT|nr:TetM/TetW/TetO/TetS family tetracycline resistance ribosomal protection protein [Clostridium oryzae]OPJ63544.1 tetracycline resistance protein TetM from transposon TnFO1 [Clostridium oryzae]
MISSDSITNIGIIAHVDSGKTTLTEQLLYKSGATKIVGSVDKGTSHTDSLQVEKERGISVKSSAIDIHWKDSWINLIDTPGHIDFAAEVERSISVLDGAIVLCSAVEGVQPQTEVYFDILRERNVPVMFFINKLDRIGANPINVITQIKKMLTENIIPMEVVAIKDHNIEVKSILDIRSDISGSIFEDIIVTLSNNNESIAEKYFSQELTLADIRSEIKVQAKKSKIYPVFFGSALKGIGITQILDGIIDFLPSAKSYESDTFSALVYKISHDKNIGKLAHIRMFNGYLKSRDEVLNLSTNKRSKVTIIKKVVNQKETDVKEIRSGEIAALSGIDCKIYDILGSDKFVPNFPNIFEPLLTLRIYAEDKEQYIPLLNALRIIEEEDPLLNVQWLKDKNEIHIQVMGKIQLEILETLILERFRIKVRFDKPSIIYKETPASSTYCEEHYTMPKPCWAIVKFHIEPLPCGSGVVYESKVRTEKIQLKYQREIENSIPQILKQGIHGWQVTDLKITLIDGEEHVMHSRPGDFAAASAMAIMKGLDTVGTTFLEPIISFRITAPEVTSSKILHDITEMRGNFENTFLNDETFTVIGKMPVATSLEYSKQLGIISSGKALMSTKLSGYAPCVPELGKDRERIGVNPLDRAKYILYVRSAL